MCCISASRPQLCTHCCQRRSGHITKQTACQAAGEGPRRCAAPAGQRAGRRACRLGALQQRAPAGVLPRWAPPACGHGPPQSVTSALAPAQYGPSDVDQGIRMQRPHHMVVQALLRRSNHQAGTTVAYTASVRRSSGRTRDSVNSMLRSTMSRMKRHASKWLVPGCAEVMVAHRTRRSTGVG
jgi:hypothetical protein